MSYQTTINKQEKINKQTEINKQTTIISLTSSKVKGKYKVNTSSGEFTFHEDTIIKCQIFKDKEFSSDEWNNVLEEENKASCFSKAIKYISFQQRSIYEVKDHLLKDFSEEIANNTVIKLQELNFLNDQLFVKNHFQLAQAKGKGPMWLKMKLREKKIPEELSEATILEYTDELQIEVLDNLISKMISKNTSLPVTKQIELIRDKLLRDGFKSTPIRQALENYQFIDESEEKLPELIKKLIVKYGSDESKTKNKVVTALMRKGYSYEMINRYYRIIEE